VAAYDYAGRTIRGVGDVNGDGTPDLLVGATGNDTAASGAGAAYVVYGPFSSMSLSASDATFQGLASSDAFGYAVGGGSDTDDDGYTEFMVGAVAYDPSALTSGGGAWIYQGTGY
jgi:hypothetical protein